MVITACLRDGPLSVLKLCVANYSLIKNNNIIIQIHFFKRLSMTWWRFLPKSGNTKLTCTQ